MKYYYFSVNGQSLDKNGDFSYSQETDMCYCSTEEIAEALPMILEKHKDEPFIKIGQFEID